MFTLPGLAHVKQSLNQCLVFHDSSVYQFHKPFIHLWVKHSEQVSCISKCSHTFTTTGNLYSPHCKNGSESTVIYCFCTVNNCECLYSTVVSVRQQEPLGPSRPSEKEMEHLIYFISLILLLIVSLFSLTFVTEMKGLLSYTVKIELPNHIFLCCCCLQAERIWLTRWSGLHKWDRRP